MHSKKKNSLQQSAVLHIVCRTDYVFSVRKYISVIVVDADCHKCVSGVRCDDVAGCSQCLGYHPPYCTEGKTCLV